MLVVRHYSGGGSSHVEWTAHIRLHYPLFVLQMTISPVCFQHAKRVFFPKEHSRVRLFKTMLHLANLTLRLYKDELGLASDNRVTRAFLDAVVAWRWVNGHVRWPHVPGAAR